MANNPKEGPIEIEAPEVRIEEAVPSREASPSSYMKSYTIQFELEDGSDEFWDSNPTPQEVRDMVAAELNMTNLWLANVRIVKLVDTTEYS